MPRSLIATAALLCCLLPARGLSAASADDLVGTWVVDTEATWDKLKALPEMAAVAANQVETVKAAFTTQFSTASFEFTTEKLVSTVNGEKKEESYTVTKTDGDTLYTDDTAADGKVSHSKVLVAKDKLELTNVAEPTQTVVLKRKAAGK